MPGSLRRRCSRENRVSGDFSLRRRLAVRILGWRCVFSRRARCAADCRMHLESFWQRGSVALGQQAASFREGAHTGGTPAPRTELPRGQSYLHWPRRRLIGEPCDRRHPQQPSALHCHPPGALAAGAGAVRMQLRSSRSGASGPAQTATPWGRPTGLRVLSAVLGGNALCPVDDSPRTRQAGIFPVSNSRQCRRTKTQETT